MSATLVDTSPSARMRVASIDQTTSWAFSRSVAYSPSRCTVIIGVSGVFRASTSSMSRGSPCVTSISATPA